MSRIVSLLRALLLFGLLSSACALTAGFLGWLHPAFDSFSHFRVHLAVAMGAISLLLLTTTWKRHALAGLTLSLVSLASVGGLPYLHAIGPVQAAFQPSQPDETVYRALHLNARFNNPRPDRLIELIRTTKPDVVLLNEVTKGWEQELSAVSQEYPYSVFCDTRRWIGTAILSRQPFVEGGRRECLDNDAMAIASIDFGGQALDVATLHLRWPWPFSQPRQITRIEPDLQSLSETALLTGDFNAVPWSYASRRVAAAGGLTSSPSVGPTWLGFSWPNWLRPKIGLPIDQVYSKGAIVLHSAGTLDEVSSDHLPIMVEFSVRAHILTASDTIISAH